MKKAALVLAIVILLVSGYLVFSSKDQAPAELSTGNREYEQTIEPKSIEEPKEYDSDTGDLPNRLDSAGRTKGFAFTNEIWELPYYPNGPNQTNITFLPYVTGIIEQFEHGGYQYFVGPHNIVAYDENTEKVELHLVDGNVDCPNYTGSGRTISDAKKVGKWLFVICQAPDTFDWNSYIDIQSMYRINLETTEVLEYNPGQFLFSEWVNPMFLLVGDSLWISSWEGVLEINTKTGQFNVYEPEELGILPPQHPANVFLRNGKIYVGSSKIFRQGEEQILGYSEFDLEKEKWTFTEANYDELDKIERPLYEANFMQDVPEYLPKYKVIAHIENNVAIKNDLFPFETREDIKRSFDAPEGVRRFILGQKGIYLSQGGEMPTLVTKLDKDLTHDVWGDKTFYVSPIEDFAFVLGDKTNEMSGIGDLEVTVINMNTGETEIAKLVNPPEPADMYASIQALKKAEWKTLTGVGVEFIDKETGEKIASILYKSPSLLIYEQTSKSKELHNSS